jgi:hypothetical protein
VNALLDEREIVVGEEGRRSVEDFGDNHDGEEARVYSQGLRLVTSRLVRRSVLGELLPSLPNNVRNKNWFLNCSIR